MLREVLLAVLITLTGLSSSAPAAAPIGDCPTCIGYPDDTSGSATDAVSGSTIEITLTAVSNGICDTDCVAELGCTFRFKQKITFGTGGGSFVVNLYSTYQGSASTTTVASGQLPGGVAADDDVRMEAKCGEFLAYSLSVSPAPPGVPIVAIVTYQCSACTKAPL